MASMIDIKRRKASIESTGQITKAMKLVSTVKLQRARQRAEESKAYFNKMYQTMTSILAKAGNIEHPYLKANGSSVKGIITISSNRGLAGGYNNNIVKMIRDCGMDKDEIAIYGVGHKAMEVLAHRGYKIVSDDSEIINEPEYEDARKLGEKVLEAFENGEIGEIYLAYTDFKNTVVHEPKLVKLLPIEWDRDSLEESQDDKLLMNFEPEPEEALTMLIPKYLCSMIYGALVTSVASENGARMQAMDSATSNAEEMISTLELAYNRARQGAITQELTEIISGAEALK
ncbi:ATP synthase F1 subunit gamma [Anaerostipes sp. 494a]|uniref:ATP synthase F1 subunit gamma n=1 Tax=Anaerostipes TaxID=207244 RepID=UPI0009511435|nr:MULTISPECIES: ATP synthase F1 subunit gamma [Anaerostipes]OLR59809.1 ATP synthase F1 subunit gamma [Anaerostipes sp. 494a]